MKKSVLLVVLILVSLLSFISSTTISDPYSNLISQITFDDLTYSNNYTDNQAGLTYKWSTNATIEDSIFGQSIMVNGSNNNSVVLSDTNTLIDSSISNGELTISFWAKSYSSGAEAIISIYNNDGNRMTAYYFNYSDALRLYGKIGCSAVSYTDGNSSEINITDWNFYLLELNQTNYNFYINEILIANSTGSNLSNFVGSPTIILGSRDGSSNMANYSIDEVKIFNKTLTSSEKTALYNNLSLYELSNETWSYVNSQGLEIYCDLYTKQTTDNQFLFIL